MLVEKGDILSRDGVFYEAICCDEEYFILAKFDYDELLDKVCLVFDELEAYTNDESINTLEELNFTKHKEE